ncbi:MAG: PAS domain S-box protein [Gammaproteobacteria bacterium]|nr:PAS domain S-box protein [Gammaproteobacteria bacterium]
MTDIIEPARQTASIADNLTHSAADEVPHLQQDCTDERLQLKLIQLVYQNSQLAAIATLVALPIVALLIWRQGSPALLLPWVATVALVTLLRTLYLHLHLARPDTATPRQLSRLRRNYLLWNFISGAAWGAAALLVTPESLPNQVFLAFILGGVAAVAVVVHGAMFSAVVLFTLPALLPMVARLYLENTQLYTAMSIATGLFICVLLVVASRMGKTSLRALRLSIVNEDLVAYLEKTKQATDHLNTVLTAEVAERRQIEARLRTERDFVSAVLDTECGLVIVLAPDGRIVRFNRACETTTGYYAHELVGRPIWDTLILPSEAPYLRLKLEAALSGCFPNECEVRWRVKQGGERRVRLSNTALIDKSGKPSHIVATGIDVTEHYVAETELARSREDFRLLVEGVSSYAIYMLDPEGRITSWNTGAERITGYQAQDVIGTHFSRFYTAEDVRRGRPSIQLRMATSEGRHEYEGWNVRKGNSQFWAAITISPVRAPDHGLLGFSVITGDLTQRKQTEDTIRALLTITEQINATLDIDLLMDSLVRQSLKLLDAAGGYAGLFQDGAFGYSHYHRGITALPIHDKPHPTASLPAQVYRTHKPYCSPDALHDTLADRDFYRNQGVRSAICCPILNYGGDVIGFIEVHNKNNEAAFSDMDEERLVSVSQSAALAIQNALAYQQITRTKNLLSEEARLMELIATGASLPVVMTALLKSLEDHLEESHAIFLSANADQTALDHYLTTDAAQSRPLPSGATPSLDRLHSHRSLSDAKAAPIYDITDDPEWHRSLDCIAPDDDRHYWLCPIRTHSPDPVGMLVIMLKRDAARHTEQLALIETTVHLAGIAIERRRAEESLHLRERAIESSVNAILVASLAHAAHPIIYANPAAASITGLSKSELLGRDLLSLYDPSGQSSGLATLRTALTNRQSGHAIVHGTRHDEGEFWAEVFLSPVRDVSGAASHFVVVMHDISDRVQAENELRQSRERLRALSTHLQTVREEEKAHLARELHDELGSTLLALKIDTSWINRHMPGQSDNLKEKTTGMMALVDNAITTTRRISSDLRPPMLDDLGLLATLEWQIHAFESRMGIACDAELEGDSERLNSQQSIALFRIFQEALTNIARHANASRVHIQVNIAPDQASMVIHDNGKGIDPAVARRPDAHGVYGMFERAHSLGGLIHLDSQPERGTRLSVQIPLDTRKTQ